jgi:hypothetical protein
MASITYTGIVAHLRGSIAGTTFHNNSSGSIAKSRPRRFGSISDIQRATANQFALLANQWGTLTILQKAAWQNMAAAHPLVDYYGASKKLTGYALYQNVNAYALLSGGSLLTTPATWNQPSPISAWSQDADKSKLKLNWATTPYTSGFVTMFFATPLLSSPSGLVRSSLRLIRVQYIANLTTIDLTSFWRSTFNLTSSPSDMSGTKRILVCVAQIYLASKQASMFASLNHIY